MKTSAKKHIRIQDLAPLKNPQGGRGCRNHGGQILPINPAGLPPHTILR